MSKNLVVGDVFEVRMDTTTVRLFQYIADDSTQLNSHVVRVFKKSYSVGEPLDAHSVTKGDIDFHAHVFLGIGVKQQLWRKVGHVQAPVSVDVLFRDTNDYGNPEIKVSRNWHIWRINGPFERVGDLRPRYEKSEVGVVVPPDSLIYRMRNGMYDFVYPGY